MDIQIEKRQEKLSLHRELMGNWAPHFMYVLHKIVYPKLKVAGGLHLPPQDKMYKALKDTQPDKVKVVVLGQDPYHNIGAATGRAFEVDKNSNYKNPSLRNIEKQLGHSLDFDKLSKEGVLFLNTALTVEKGKAGSHTKIWAPFMEEFINIMNDKDDIVWLIWGRHALNWFEKIKNPTHKAIISSHPSPFSWQKPLGKYPSFEKSNCFQKAEELSNIKF